MDLNALKFWCTQRQRNRFNPMFTTRYIFRCDELHLLRENTQPHSLSTFAKFNFLKWNVFYAYGIKEMCSIGVQHLFRISIQMSPIISDSVFGVCALLCVPFGNLIKKKKFRDKCDPFTFIYFFCLIFVRLSSPEVQECHWGMCFINDGEKILNSLSECYTFDENSNRIWIFSQMYEIKCWKIARNEDLCNQQYNFWLIFFSRKWLEFCFIFKKWRLFPIEQHTLSTLLYTHTHTLERLSNEMFWCSYFVQFYWELNNSISCRSKFNTISRMLMYNCILFWLCFKMLDLLDE